jgi:hypothetical protein
MARWKVTVDRTERIEFELDALDMYDAEERYLTDGEEVGSETMKLDVLATELVPDD